MLSLAAAVSAPLRTKSQKALPGTPWVTIATVTRGVSAVPAVSPLSEVRGRPPVLEHDARASTAARQLLRRVLFCCDGDDVTCGDVPSLGSINIFWSVPISRP